MGRHSTTGGVIALGHNRIQFEFKFEGRRYRPTLLMTPTALNLRRHARTFNASRLASPAALSPLPMSFRIIGTCETGWTRTSCAPAIGFSMSSSLTAKRGGQSTISRKPRYGAIGDRSIGSGVHVWVRYCF